MKIGVCAVLLSNLPLTKALEHFRGIGIEAVEIGAGGYPGKAHCNPAKLLSSPDELKAFKETVGQSGLELSALSCHGNPIHPDKDKARAFHDDFINAVRLAEKLGVKRIIAFSGCPGDSPGSKYPNWATCPWPDDYSKILKYQWEDVLIPYWEETVKTCRDYGVTQVALEMHPGPCAYNPETLLKLRNAVGDIIGANLDPSHLIWQQINPSLAARLLKDAVYHVHAKDTKIDSLNTSRNGVLDTKHYSEELERSWIFRTVGYGNGFDYWKEFISTLRLIGYDDILSIEHEDSVMTNDEGLSKAVSFLKECIISQSKPSEMFWA
ncbi:MAG: sugar phosphate isomerase/epimerase [Eubacteriales bacterium]